MPSRRRNPYGSAKGGPRQRLPVAAFVDILGYTEMVRETVSAGEGPMFLRRLKTALDRALKPIYPTLDPLLDKDLYAVKVFTDNIVIGHPVHEDAESELGHIFEQLASFQLEMATAGFFVRGGVAIGQLYMDENIVFGPALIDAYGAEQNQARDPRIVLTQSAVTAVKYHLTYYARPHDAPQTREFFVDSDGQYFLNYLESVVPDADEPDLTILNRHKQQVEKVLRRYRARPPIWSKYAWVAGYHNFFCRLQHCPERLLIDLSKYQMTPSLIA